VALEELAAHRDREFVQWAAGLAGASKRLFSQDLSRVEQEASSRGVDRDRARALLRDAGLDLQENALRAWSPCHALPGAPASLDAAGATLLEHPAHGYAAIKRGDMQQWLAVNDAPASITEVAAEVRRLADRQASEAHIVHTLAWLFGRTELVLGRTWVRTPSELGPAVRAGQVSTDDLARAARDRVLGAWLRRSGFNAAASAADALGRGEALGLERLAWALGEPLRVGELAFTDPVTLAQTALTTPSMRDALLRAFSTGELLAWMESLPPSRRDDSWIERLRRAKAQGSADTRALWAGVYGALGTRATLTLRSSSGSSIELSNIKQLTSTLELASVWDALKASYRSGELLAWIAAVSPENDYVDQERPDDDDAALNELTWELGHTGLVVEWGQSDQAITSPDDLVRLYRIDWKWFEAQLRRGYVLKWLERFHGKRLFGGVALEVLIDRLRAEMPTLPAGFVALKTALLCGLRQLPLDPCEPGDPATFFGYIGAGAPGATAESWEPLRSHMTWGAGHLWVAQLPNVKASTLPLLMNTAFVTTPGAMRDAPDRLLKALAASLGGPVPSPALAARLGRASQVPQVAQGLPPQAPTPTPTLPTSEPSARHTTAPSQATSGPQKSSASSRGGGAIVAVLALLALGAASLYVVKNRRRWPLLSGEAPPSRAPQLCSLAGDPLEIGSSILAERGIHANSYMDEVDIAWVQAGARPSGDGVGWARIRGSGALERGSVRSEDLPVSAARDQRRTIYRVFATHSTTPGQGSFVLDQLLSEGARREVIACGAMLSAQQLAGGRASTRTAALHDPLADVPAGAPDWRSMVFCRTIGDSNRLIVGARGKERNGQLLGAELFMTMDNGVTTRSLASWPLQTPRIRSAERPMVALREQAPTSAEGARGATFSAIAVTGRDRVYAWLLDASHRPVINGAMLSRDSDPGPARVAVGAVEALVLWVDRQSSGRSLFAARLASNGTTTITPLAPLAQPGDEPIAPSVAPLDDGGWLISWVQRKSSSAARAAWLQRYDRSLRPLGEPLEVSRGQPVVTARLAHDSVLGFTVAYATEGGTVFAARGRCL
jgi:hypothetical protein